MSVVTTAPTYLFWRCAPPELRVPQELIRAIRDQVPFLVAVALTASVLALPVVALIWAWGRRTR